MNLKDYNAKQYNYTLQGGKLNEEIYFTVLSFITIHACPF